MTESMKQMTRYNVVRIIHVIRYGVFFGLDHSIPTGQDATAFLVRPRKQKRQQRWASVWVSVWASVWDSVWEYSAGLADV